VSGISCSKNASDAHVQGKKWIVTTIAGDGRSFFADGPVLSAAFKSPLDVAVDANGIIYVADGINHRIRKIADGQVSTYVGTGRGDTVSGNIGNASFSVPDQLVLDNSGNLYALDIEDPRVRKISNAGFVSVYAGSGTKGFADGSAASAQFGEEASGIAIDEQGNIFMTDFDNRRIRKINTNGDVTTIAGNGNMGFVDGKGDSAQFFAPAGIVVDKHGNVFVGDWNRIRKIAPDGTVSTFAGQDSSGFRDGSPGQALFSFIMDLAMDDEGNIYLSDENRIRKVTPQGVVSTIAGGEAGYEDGDGTVAKFFNPAGLGIDKKGNIYVADDQNHRIRKISFE